VYFEAYKDTSGLEFLEKAGVELVQLKLKNDEINE